MLEDGTLSSINGLAEAERIDRGYVCRLLNLTLLSPEITGAVLDGKQPKGILLEEMVRAVPAEWAEQRGSFGLL